MAFAEYQPNASNPGTSDTQSITIGSGETEVYIATSGAMSNGQSLDLVVTHQITDSSESPKVTVQLGEAGKYGSTFRAPFKENDVVTVVAAQCPASADASNPWVILRSS